MKKFPTVCILIICVFASIISQTKALAAERKPRHYLEENETRYEAFQERNPDIPYASIVAYVNANVDMAHYSNIEVLENPSDITALLSKNFALPDYYEPSDLVTLPGGGELRAAAAAAYIEMRSSAAENGLTFVIRSAYRNHSSQVASYNLVRDNYGLAGAEISVARAGHSEHQLGLALDIMDRPTTGPLTVQGFDQTREYFWLLENAHKFGFIQRYPAAYRHLHGFDYEPWHWRFVGVRVATRMHNLKIATFEEYYGRYLAPAVVKKNQRHRPILETSIGASRIANCHRIIRQPKLHI